MMDFLAANGGTILIALIVVALIVLILWTMRRSKKKGKSSCGCDCGHCPSAGMCHKE